MPESLFGFSLRSLLLPRQGVTDSVTPPSTSSVAVYSIHSFEQPFCADAQCPCYAQEQEGVRLFVSIIEGRFDLEPAAPLLAVHGMERHA